MFHDVNSTLARRHISNLRPCRPLLTLAQRQFAIWDDEEIGGPWWCNGDYRTVCPLMTQWGNWKPVSKAMGKLWGAKWHDEENRKLGLWWRNGTLIWGALWWRNGQIRDPRDDEIGSPLMTWWGNWDPRPLILSNGLIRFHCTLSNLWAPNFIWEILDVMQA